MAASSQIPLYLFQVLEEEYVALHNESPLKQQEFKLPDRFARGVVRKVTPTFDWSFDASHIRDAGAFIAALSPPRRIEARAEESETNKTLRGRVNAAFRAGQNAVTRIFKQPEPSGYEDPDKSARHNLKDYLRDKHFLDNTLSKDRLAEVLNAVLEDDTLFDEERFSTYWLNDATRGLRDIHKPPALVSIAPSATGILKGDDLKHFNRLLLEDAFPRYIEQIHRIRLAAIHQRIHEKKPKALCLSGGGIRSGTFALGLLQGLSRHSLLNQFHYLSTVSGGGYIGSWLAAWIHRHPQGLNGVMADLANKKPQSTVDPDPDPIRYLRRYSSFITPKVGLLSADTWTFISIYLRNLLLNWLVFIPFLITVLMLPRLIVALTVTPGERMDVWNFNSVSWANFNELGRYVFMANVFVFTFDKSGPWVFLAIGFVSTVLALAYIMFNRPTRREELRQASTFWRGRSSQRYFLWWCLLPLSIAALSLTTHWAWASQKQEGPRYSGLQLGLIFILFGVAATLFAWLVSLIVLGRNNKPRISSDVRHFRFISRNLFALIVSGIVGGLLLWVITQLFDPFAAGGLNTWASGVTGWNWWDWRLEIYACLAGPAFLLVFLLGATLYIGLSSKSHRVDDDDREWWARLSAWVLIVILGWSIFTTLVVFGPLALLSAPQWLAPLGGVSGLLAALAGKSAKTRGVAKSSGGEESAIAGVVHAIMRKILPLLALIFTAFLVVTLSLATTGIFQEVASKLSRYITPNLSNHLADSGNYLQCIFSRVPGKDYFERNSIAHMRVLHLTSFWFVLLLLLVFLGLSSFFSGWINLNLFSLHAGYRNRLIRAFLGASRPDHERKPNPFTGFDPADNFSMHELRPGLFDEDDFPDAVKLANVLLNYTNPNVAGPKVRPVAEYLDTNGLLNTLKSIPDPDCYSIRLLAALRKDLNAALQQPDFFIGPTQNGADKRSNLIYDNRGVLERAFGELIRPRKPKEAYRLMPIINTTLNLVGGDNLAWQQRKAEPFSISPLYSGCFRLGYRDSRFYGGRDSGGISIGTAAAISGAAASSNMGYYTTSPLLSLVLTFFNVRLGWWLGNPGSAGNKTFHLWAPKSSVMPILDEALGLTDDKNEYVYLTDGGHFENLGLYEMVLRRCHVIVVSDAAADADYRFGDLGNAIRKVRIDLGIPIEFTAMPIFCCEPGETKRGLYWAIGKIRYSCVDGVVDDGVLLYIKPAIYGEEPRDVLEYKKNNPTFPHQSTADQFFDEPQFESYRILGSHVMDQMCGPENNVLQINEALGGAVANLLDTENGGPVDPKLRDWWEKLFPSSKAQANQFWNLMRK
jgi:hypothetical protein